MMIDRYNNHYKERSTSRDKVNKRVSDGLENVNITNQPQLPKPVPMQTAA